MIINQPKSSQIDKRTQDKAKVSLLYLHYIFFAFKINQFFQYFLFSIQILTKSREFEFSGLACQWSPYSSYSFTRNLQRWIKVRSFVIPVYVNLLHSGAFVTYSGVTLVSFLFVVVSFQLVLVYSGTILVHSVSFRLVAVFSATILVHSVSFRRVPVYSVPFHSVPVFSNAHLLQQHIWRATIVTWSKNSNLHLNNGMPRYWCSSLMRR